MNNEINEENKIVQDKTPVSISKYWNSNLTLVNLLEDSQIYLFFYLLTLILQMFRRFHSVIIT